MAAQKNVSSSTLGFISRNSLICLFPVTSILFLLSWFFILRSTTPPHFINQIIFSPNSKPFPSHNQTNVDPFVRNRSIHVHNNQQEQEEEASKERKTIQQVLTKDYHTTALKVFMYDLPSQFHFELLDWKPEEGSSSVWPDIRTTIPRYPGGLNLQHSIEYWLTLDLLATQLLPAPIKRARSAIRVYNSSEADIIFVPFFSSLSYNRYSKADPHVKRSRNKVLQEKLVNYVTAQKEWKRSRGIDHLILAHHPNSMLYARNKVWPATFILSDFGRYPPNIANVEKDIIAPYKHVIKSFVNDSSTFDTRPILLFFQGAIYRKDGGLARQELFYMLKDEEDVHFAFGSVQKGGVHNATIGMHSSKFCLNIAGDTPSSNRLFDAIASHCVPVIISDDIELPYEDALDYSQFCVFIRTSDALKENFLLNLVRGIGREEWTRMWEKLKAVEDFYEYRYPSKEGDAVQMIWQAVSRKIPAIRMKLHKSRRFAYPVSGVMERYIHMPHNFG